MFCHCLPIPWDSSDPLINERDINNKNGGDNEPEESRVVAVRVSPGMRPGQKVPIKGMDGKVVHVRIPHGKRVGQSFFVKVSSSGSISKVIGSTTNASSPSSSPYRTSRYNGGTYSNHLYSEISKLDCVSAAKTLLTSPESSDTDSDDDVSLFLQSNYAPSSRSVVSSSSRRHHRPKIARKKIRYPSTSDTSNTNFDDNRIMSPPSPVSYHSHYFKNGNNPVYTSASNTFDDFDNNSTGSSASGIAGQKMIQVQVPPDAPPGSTIQIEVPDEPGRFLDAQVPPNVGEFYVAYKPSHRQKRQRHPTPMLLSNHPHQHSSSSVAAARAGPPLSLSRNESRYYNNNNRPRYLDSFGESYGNPYYDQSPPWDHPKIRNARSEGMIYREQQRNNIFRDTYHQDINNNHWRDFPPYPPPMASPYWGATMRHSNYHLTPPPMMKENLSEGHHHWTDNNDRYYRNDHQQNRDNHHYHGRRDDEFSHNDYHIIKSKRSYQQMNNEDSSNGVFIYL